MQPMGSGEAIKRGRERLGWEQADLANAVDVSRTTVSNWETGKAEPRNKLGKVYEVLGLDEQGQPNGVGDDLAATLGSKTVKELIDFQSRLTAEIAWRLSLLPADLQDPRIPPRSHLDTGEPPPFGVDVRITGKASKREDA